MKHAAIAYALLVIVIGLLVTAVMTRETDTEKQEAKAEQEAEAKEPKTPPAEIAPAEEIANRVAAIRDTEFDNASPKVLVVPPEELTKKLTELDAEPPQDKNLVAAGAILLAQAGALPPDQAEQLVNRRYGGTGTLAAYLPKENAILVDEELAESDPEIAEAAAAGEMSRALDSVGPQAPRVPPLFHDDEAARVTIFGGVAGFVEREYAAEHLEGEVDAEAARDSRLDPETPPALETLSHFPTTVGTAFVRGAHKAGGWDAVDELLGETPTTTQELLKANAAEAVPAPRFAVKSELGKPWKRLASADVGRLDTVALLRAGLSERNAVKLSDGYRSARFETWIKGKPQQGCAPPCAKKSVTVVVHRWGDAADADTFNKAMRDSLISGDAGATPDGGRGFEIGTGGGALVRAGRFTALVFAPDAQTAGAIAQKALEA
ncbi:MAG TPA: hypothetical protein VF587_06185 [Solirubrobacteraceae bacterium]